MEGMELIKNKSLQFWKNKRVLITGHTGFKGGWLSLWLSHLGAKVTGYALKPQEKRSFFNVVKLSREINSNIGNIKDLKKLNKIVSENKPEIIFHMAAQPLVLDSYLDPKNTYETNVMGTLNILEILRSKKNIKALVNVTTDKCYLNNSSKKNFIESDPLGGYDPYSSSKACSEILTASYRDSYFTGSKFPNIASARAGNVIGGGDWSQNRIIPDILNAIYSNKKIDIRNPLSTRPWQYVLEPLCGYMLLAEKLYFNTDGFSDAWNFGPKINNLKNVKWIVNKMHNLKNTKPKILNSNKIKKYESKYLSLNSTKSMKKLKWKNIFNLEQALESIIQWHDAFENKKNMSNFSKYQIENYIKRLGDNNG